MKFSEIKERCIYNVIFDPVRQCEFDNKHLALVLKKNNDKKTCVVMPFTSESNGVGRNKFKVGSIHTLPSSLKSNDTYAVFNQIRTVNASRFISLKEGSDVIDAKIEDDLYIKLLHLGIKDLTFNLDLDESLEFFKCKYEEVCVSKSIDLAYAILKLKSGDNNDSEIEELESQIKDILSKDIKFTLDQVHLNNGIDNILNNIIYDLQY